LNWIVWWEKYLKRLHVYGTFITFDSLTAQSVQAESSNYNRREEQSGNRRAPSSLPKRSRGKEILNSAESLEITSSNALPPSNEMLNVEEEVNKRNDDFVPYDMEKRIRIKDMSTVESRELSTPVKDNEDLDKIEVIDPKEEYEIDVVQDEENTKSNEKED